MTKQILLINGPNLNLLGSREPEIYGRATLKEIELRLSNQAKEKGVGFDCFQSNHEGNMIDRIHTAKQDKVNAIIINPGGLTHTSISLRDAFSATAIPFIEVHISNVYQREAFRHTSFLSPIAVGVICGLGIEGYTMAMDFAIKNL